MNGNNYIFNRGDTPLGNEESNRNNYQTTEKIEVYLKDRVDDQIEWYDGKSIQMQKKHKIFKGVTIFSAAIIPIISLTKIEYFDTDIIVSILAAIIAISEGMISLSNYGDNWTRYRSICETLKSEKYMYLNQSGVYSEKEENFSFFVERVETIISQENINWASLNNESKKEG